MTVNEIAGSADLSIEKRRGWPRLVIGMTLLLAVSGLLLADVYRTRLANAALLRETEKLEQQRRDLRATANGLQRAAEEAQQFEREILSVFNGCRTAEDVPELGPDWVVAKHQGTSELLFYVPAGTHALEVKAVWRRRDAPESSETDASQQNEESAGGIENGEKTWQIPLLPESGYRLEVPESYQPRQLEWRLTGNHPRFSTRTEQLPFDEFRQRGWSSRSWDKIAFPNQIDGWRRSDIEAALQTPPGLKLWDITIRGPYQEHSYAIDFVVRLISEGPVHATPEDIQRLLILNRELRFTYRGGGKYEVRYEPAESGQ